MRSIGPFIGGRGTSVVGHPTDKHVFFGGHASGAFGRPKMQVSTGSQLVKVSSTTDPLVMWQIYEADPDIMYVGLGEPQMRNDVSYGDGVYRSLDGGDTWEHLGLEEARSSHRSSSTLMILTPSM